MENKKQIIIQNISSSARLWENAGPQVGSLEADPQRGPGGGRVYGFTPVRGGGDRDVVMEGLSSRQPDKASTSPTGAQQQICLSVAPCGAE